MVPRSQLEDPAGNTAVSEESELELVEPRVPIALSISRLDQSQLWAGQIGWMMLRGREQNLFDYVAAKASDFLRVNLRKNHGL